jgi:putative holliday junction resolvase
VAAAGRTQLARQPGGGPRLNEATALGFDFGLRRIGVAVGDTLTKSAAPLATVSHDARGPDWPAIERLLNDYKPTMLVVGYPYNESGSPGSLAGAAGRFASELAQRSGLTVARVDERYSSQEASAELKQRRALGSRRRRVQRADVDSLAAAIILERWLRGEG